MVDVFETKKYLPKCFLAVIPKYWYPTLPIDYPETTTVFDFVKGDDKVAMIEMEKNLGTENSIIAEEDIPEKEAVGAYLGTYDVEGEAGEEVLISPNKLPENAIGAFAYHYDSENDSWDKIDDVVVKDGYVYATLEEFSPIAVFALTVAAYLTSAADILPKQSGNVLVCNGIPTKVYRDKETDKMVAEAGALKFELEDNDSIIGGSVDGTNVETTNVAILEGAKLNYVIGGCFSTTVEEKAYTKTVNVSANKAEIGMLVGAGIWNCADVVNMTCIDSKIKRGMGSQQTHLNGKAANKTMEDSDKGLGANQWVKKANVICKNSEIYVLYSGGLNGYCTTLDAYMEAENCTCEYACNGQSNGTIYNSESILTGCKITYLNNNNRGHYGDGKLTLKGNNVITNQYVFCDNDPNAEMADVRGKISIDINASDTIESFYAGSVANHEVTTAEEADKYVSSIKISRSANIIYANKADIVLKDVIRIK